jgi:hypothetical protein
MAIMCGMIIQNKGHQGLHTPQAAGGGDRGTTGGGGGNYGHHAARELQGHHRWREGGDQGHHRMELRALLSGAAKPGAKKRAAV